MATPSPSRIVLRAPLSGVLVPIDRVPDPVFAQRIAGDGVAIDPTSHTLLAPCAGRLAHVHAAGHALTIRTAEGVEVMVHIGLDTVKLRGQGFRQLARAGDDVDSGTPLVEFDADFVAAHTRSLLTQVVVTTPERVARLLTRTGHVRAGVDIVAEIEVKPTGADATGEAAEITSPPIVVRLVTGLHARPAARLANAARAFDADLSLQRGTHRANAKSLLSLMGLEVAPGDTVRVAGSGPEAAAAVAHLAALLEASADEAPTRSDTQAAATGSPVSPPAGTAAVPGVLHGVAASPGLAVGWIVRVARGRVEVPRRGGDPAQERRSLERAIDRVRADVQQVQARLRSGADQDRAAIFAAQEALLADPDLLDLAAAGIDEGRSAGFAWREAVERHASQLALLSSDLLAARANDLRDVGGRVLRLLAGHGETRLALPAGSILVAEDLTPSDTAALDRDHVVGFCTTGGGATSHTAILARALALPAVVAIDARALDLADGTRAVIDGTHGVLRADPSEEDVARIERRRARDAARQAAHQSQAREPAVTRDGVRIQVTANVDRAGAAESLVALGSEGVGLLRSEFLFIDRAQPPSEDEQATVYSSIARALGPSRPLVVRVLDAGGDKPLACLAVAHEVNPSLGERGIRVLLDRPDVLRTQLRAVLRASAFGAVHVMFPMVAQVGEWRAARALLHEEAARLGVSPVPAGIMVEVPSAALLADAFAEDVDFFSIGTNDLAQFVLAMDRGHPRLAAQMDALHPAVLRLVARTTEAALVRGKPVAVCGALAADGQAIPVLLGLGVRQLSVSAPEIASVKAQVRTLDLAACRHLAARALEASSAEEVRGLVPAAPDAGEDA